MRRIFPGVLEVHQCERTHAYALRGAAIRDLFRAWHALGLNKHCDWAMGDWQVRRRVYAPDPCAGQSDITGAALAERWWQRLGLLAVLLRPTIASRTLFGPAQRETVGSCGF